MDFGDINMVFGRISLFLENKNLGPKRLSLLEFETWPLRPLGHRGQLNCYHSCWVILSGHTARNLPILIDILAKPL